MSSLHLSLLILAIAVLIALYLIGRHKANADRPKPTRKRRKREVPGSSVKTPPHAAEAADQMDLWKKAPGNGATGGEASGSGTGFDEFGVGQPRRIENAKILLANTSMDADKIKVYGSRCLLYTSPSPRDRTRSRMPSSA